MSAAAVDDVSKCYQGEEPTPASTWGAVAARPITDELLEWPPDLFALTDLILRRSEAYRFILSPRTSMTWPPSRFQSWTKAIDESARQWSEWVEDRERGLPNLLREEWSAFRERTEVPVEHLAEG